MDATTGLVDCPPDMLPHTVRLRGSRPGRGRATRWHTQDMTAGITASSSGDRLSPRLFSGMTMPNAPKKTLDNVLAKHSSVKPNMHCMVAPQLDGGQIHTAFDWVTPEHHCFRWAPTAHLLRWPCPLITARPAVQQAGGYRDHCVSMLNSTAAAGHLTEFCQPAKI